MARISISVSGSVIGILSFFVFLTGTYGQSTWPDSTTTGLADFSALSARAAFTVGDSGALVENYEITGQLTIGADNVTVRNCRIFPGGNYAVVVDEDVSGAVIEDCDIGGTGQNGTKGILIRSNAGVTVRRCYIHHVEDGIFGGGANSVIEDNYFNHIRAPEDLEPPHCYKGDGIEALGPCTNLVIRHNTFIMPPDQTSCIITQAHWGDFNGLRIEDNLLDGGGYTVYSRIRDPRIFTGLAITGNRFGRNYGYGVWSNDVPDSEYTVYGNVWDDTGEALPEPLGTVVSAIYGDGPLPAGKNATDVGSIVWYDVLGRRYSPECPSGGMHVGISPVSQRCQKRLLYEP